MKAFHIAQTFQTPAVVFDPANNIFEINGNSLPNNPHWFYMPVLEWLDAYAESPNPETVFSFRLSHQNSSTKKMFYEILKVIDRIHVSGSKVRLDWYYPADDDDLLEAGIEFEKSFTFPLRTISVQPPV
ncbi:MAG: DUF1987 domain-containing protein [Bacteroidia bacterium]